MQILIEGTNEEFNNIKQCLVKGKFCEESEISYIKPPRWRAKKDFLFYYVSSYGNVCSYKESGNNYCDVRYKTQNYFKSEDEAKNSPIYKALNEEWED